MSGTRLSALRARAAREGAEAFLASSIANITYLTGIEGALDPGANAAALVTSDDAWLLTDFRYAEAARSALAGRGWEVREVSGPLVDEACALGQGLGFALESTASVGRRMALEQRLGAEVAVAEGWVEDLRQVKEPGEIERIAAAAGLADAGMAFAAETLREGMSEREAALQIEFWMRRAGSEGVAFPPIVASGPNAARPHAIPGERVLAGGDLVIVDVGARVDGYCSDLTRTFTVGPAPDRATALHAAVLAAQEAGLTAIRAGIAARDADAAARASLRAAGLDEVFGHGLGHGVGLEVHEAPTVGPRSEAVLPAGSVVTVEPGAYVTGFGGVRIEDLVVVADGAARVLSGYPKELAAIG